MRFVEIRSHDKTVIIDGVFLKLNFELGKNDSVVYWDDSEKSGWVDAKKGKGRKIDSLKEFSSIIEDFKAKTQDHKKTDFTMRIVPDDKLVTIDDVAIDFDFDIDQNYHAVHWDGDSGFIETRQGMNLKIFNVDEFEAIVKKHTSIVAKKEKAAAKKIKELDLPENVTKRAIAALEAEITPRRYREALLTESGKEWLAAKEVEIQALRDSL